MGVASAGSSAPASLVWEGAGMVAGASSSRSRSVRFEVACVSWLMITSRRCISSALLYFEENNMTNGNPSEEIYLENYASDLWGSGKNLPPLSSEEQFRVWRKTVDVLRHLADAADILMLEPLILAVGDAYSRAREELARAEDRLSRPQGEELHPRERERLVKLEARYEALAGADLATLSAEAAEAFEEMRKEAGESLQRYRIEIGMTEPTA
jgi:hypothetical protein